MSESMSTDQASFDQLTRDLESARRKLEKHFQEANSLKESIAKESDSNRATKLKESFKSAKQAIVAAESEINELKARRFNLAELLRESKDLASASASVASDLSSSSASSSANKQKIPDDKTWTKFSIKTNVILNDYLDSVEHIGVAGSLSSKDLARMQGGKFSDISLGRAYNRWFLEQVKSAPPDWNAAKNWFRANVSADRNAAERVEDFKRLQCSSTTAEDLATFNLNFQDKARLANMGMDSEVLLNFYEAAILDSNLSLALANWKAIQVANLTPITLNKIMDQTMVLAGTIFKKRKVMPFKDESSEARNDSMRDKIVKCNFCHKLNHLEKDCKKKKNMEANKKTEYKSSSTASKTDARTCYNCKEVGHISPNCPKPKQEKSSMIKSTATSNTLNAKSTSSASYNAAHSNTKLYTIQVDESQLKLLRNFQNKEDESDASVCVLEVQEEALIMVEGKEWVHQKSVIAENVKQGKTLTSSQDISLLASKDPRPYVACEIHFGKELEHTIQVYALLDSGANKTFISRNVLNAMNSIQEMQLAASNQVKLAQNQMGFAQLMLETVQLVMLGRTPVTVVNSIHVHEDTIDLILGIREMRQAGWVVDSEIRFQSDVKLQAEAIAMTAVERTDCIFAISDFTAEEIEARRQGITEIREALDRNKVAYEGKLTKKQSTLFSMPEAVFHIKHFADTPPAWENQFPLSEAAEILVEKWLQKMIDKDQIECFPLNEKRRYNIPIFVVKENTQKAKKARVVLNAVRLNQGVVPSSYQIPSILDMVDLAPGDVISELDVVDAFHNIQLADDSKSKLSFTFRQKAYRYKVAALGLVNLSEHFQEVLSRILMPLEGTKNYIDNIFQTTPVDVKETGVQQLQKAAKNTVKVIEVCTANNVWLSAEKAADDKLLCRRIKSLGMMFTPQGRGIDPTKLDELRKMKLPISAKEAKSFIQFVSFFRSHIRHFSDLVHPFTEMTKSTWNKTALSSQQNRMAFDKILQAVASAPLLRRFEPSLPTVCLVDASQVAIAAVIFQLRKDKVDAADFLSPSPDNFLCCSSRVTRDFEKSYPIVKKEALTITWIIDTFYDLIIACRDFTFVTDAMSVYYIGVNKKFDRTAANWYAKLLLVPHVKFRWIPGDQNIAPDFLSRMYDTVWGVGTQDHNRFQQHKKKIRDLISNISVADIEHKIDTIYVHQLYAIESGGQAVKRSAGNTDSAVTQSSVIVPTASERLKSVSVNGVKFLYPEASLLQQEHIQEAHSGRHGGVSLTTAILHSKGLKWPYMTHHIKEHLDACEVCLQWKKTKPVFVPTTGSISTYPFQVVQVDFISGLTKTSSLNEQLLICICCFTRFVILIPMQDKTSTTIADHLFRLWALIGPPQVYQADNEPCLWGEAIEKVKLLFGILDRRIAAYAPMKNGLVERHVQEVTTLLNKLIALHGLEWDVLVPFVQLSLNTSCTQTSAIPFEMVFARPCQFFGGSLHLPTYTSPELEDKNFIEWFNHLRSMEEFLYPFVKEQREHRQLLNKDSSIFDTFGKRMFDYPLEIGQAVRVREPLAYKVGNKFKTPVETIGYIEKRLSTDTYQIVDRGGVTMQRAIPRSHISLLNYAPANQALKESAWPAAMQSSATSSSIVSSSSSSSSSSAVSSVSPVANSVAVGKGKGKQRPTRKQNAANKSKNTKKTPAVTVSWAKLEKIVGTELVEENGVQKTYFVCRWDGYGSDDDTLEPSVNIPSNTLRKYLKEHPTVVSP